MQREQFNQLKFNEKLKWIYVQGEFITSIRYYAHKVNLYAFGDYFVELFYHNATDNIDRICILDHKSTRMKFYADQIKLPFSFAPANSKSD